MSTQNTVLFALLTCFLSRPAWGGLAEIDAGGEGVFTEYRCSVIVAKVDKLWKVASPDSDIKNHAILSPLATLAGTFDPSLHSSLPVEFYSDGVTSSIKDPPKQGATVLAVIRYQVLIHGDPDPRNLIVSEVCRFMPGNSALVVIKGMDDTRVNETLRKLQEARANPSPDPYRGNTAKPKK